MKFDDPKRHSGIGHPSKTRKPDVADDEQLTNPRELVSP